MTIRTIQHFTPDYEQMIALRIKVLLQPIGVPASFINREKEKEDILIGAFEDGTIAGCCVLTPKNSGTVQLRQMAVATNQQGTGIGAAIVAFAERVAREHNYTLLMMHARSAVAGFYLKSGYTVVGDEFEEVGIAHRIMQKELQ